MDQLVYQLKTERSTWRSLHRCSLGLHQSCHISLCSRFRSDHLLLTRKLSRSGCTAMRQKSCFWPHEQGQNTYLQCHKWGKLFKVDSIGATIFFLVILDTKTRKLSLASASLRYTLGNGEEQDSSLSRIQVEWMLQCTPSQFQSWGWTSLLSPTWTPFLVLKVN